MKDNEVGTFKWYVQKITYVRDTLVFIKNHGQSTLTDDFLDAGIKGNDEIIQELNEKFEGKEVDEIFWAVVNEIKEPRVRQTVSFVFRMMMKEISDLRAEISDLKKTDFQQQYIQQLKQELETKFRWQEFALSAKSNIAKLNYVRNVLYAALKNGELAENESELSLAKSFDILTDIKNQLNHEN